MMTLAPDSTPDRDLVARLIERRDEDAFRTLYQRHSPMLRALVARYVHGTGVDADDLLQEAWLRAVRALPRFRWASSLRTWLSGIALNQAREALRKLGRSREDTGVEYEMADVRSSDTGLRMDLERALAQLPDGYREVLLLHDWQGFKHHEIAEALGIAIGTSRSQLHHARNRMRRLLDQDHEVKTP